MRAILPHFNALRRDLLIRGMVFNVRVELRRGWDYVRIPEGEKSQVAEMARSWGLVSEKGERWEQQPEEGSAEQNANAPVTGGEGSVEGTTPSEEGPGGAAVARGKEDEAEEMDDLSNRSKHTPGERDAIPQNLALREEMEIEMNQITHAPSQVEPLPGNWKYGGTLPRVPASSGSPPDLGEDSGE